MKLFAWILALCLPLAAQVDNASKVYQSAHRPRALAIIGDRYHSPIVMRDGLSTALVRENIPVTFLEDVTALTAESLAEYQLLIMARNGRYWPDGYVLRGPAPKEGSAEKPVPDKPFREWMTEAQERAINEFVARGGGLLAMHNAQTYYPPEYSKLIGATFGGHPHPYTFTIVVENPNHPITAGVENYEIFDEQHMSKYTLDSEHLLLRSLSRENVEAAAGWWQEVGKGRICYLTPGHTPEALNHPMTQRLIRNAARWLVHEDGDGASSHPGSVSK